LDGDLLAESFELVDVGALAPFGIDPLPEEAATKVAVAGVRV